MVLCGGSCFVVKKNLIKRRGLRRGQDLVSSHGAISLPDLAKCGRCCRMAINPPKGTELQGSLAGRPRRWIPGWKALPYFCIISLVSFLLCERERKEENKFLSATSPVPDVPHTAGEIGEDLQESKEEHNEEYSHALLQCQFPTVCLLTLFL